MSSDNALVSILEKAIDTKIEKTATRGKTQTVSADFIGTDEQGISWVRLEGSSGRTPIRSSYVEVSAGDKVAVTVGNGYAVISSNISNPSAGVHKIQNITKNITHIENNLQYNYAHVTDGIIDNAYIDHAKVQDLDANYAHITEGTIDNAEIDHAKVKNLEANYAHIGKGIIDNAKIGYADVQDLNAHYAHIEKGVIDNAKIGHADVLDLQANYAHIVNGVIDNAKIDDADVNNLEAHYAHITNGEIDNAQISHAKVKDLNANYAHITNGDIDNANINHARVNGLNANYAHIANGVIDNATIDQADVNNLSANYAHIANGVIDNAKIDQADVNNLSANYAHITNGSIDNAKIHYGNVDQLNSHYAQIDLANIANGTIKTAMIDDAQITAAKIKNGEITTAKIGDAQITSAKIGSAAIKTANIEQGAITNALIANEAVGDAQIIGVSANKLTAGTIDANKITVTNLNAKNIKVEKINGQTVTGKSIADALATHESDISDLDDKIDDAVEELNSRIDAQIQTYTVTGVPTLNNYPANEWATAALKQEHVGDICYLVNAASEYDGFTYRFAYDNTTSSYGWVLIKDNQVTAALQRLSDVEGDVASLQSFESETSSWIDETDQGITTIRQNHTSLVAVVDKTVKASVQLWFTKANTTAPAAPTSHITTNDPASANTWNLAVPTYSSTYLNYFYCWEYQYTDNTYGWSAVVRDIAMGETQSTARSAQSTANTANTNASNAVSTANSANTTASNAANTANNANVNAANALSTANTAASDASSAVSTANTANTNASNAVSTANTANTNASNAVSTANTAKATADKNIKSSVLLWFSKANATAPDKPTSKVTSTDTGGNAWRVVVPTYNSSYPYYFYCYQYVAADGTVTWSDVVYDRATTETQSTARAASSSLTSYITSNNQAVASLQSQIDGAVDIWYGSSDPAASTKPWPSGDADSIHEGDLYYNTMNGHSFRYVKSGNTYSWSQIPDSDAAAALAAANTAQATADGKRRIFTSQPAPPYDIGDLWVNGKVVKYASVKRESGSYVAADWALTATDDTAANAAQSTANSAATAAATADGKAVTAQGTANANIKSSIMLWFSKANSTTPGKPTSQVTSTSTGGNAWTTVVPVWNATYPHYFYCYQQQKGDGTWLWTDVVYDRATSEAQQKAAAALPASTFTTFQSTTFKELVDEVDEQSSTITTLTETTQKIPIGEGSGEHGFEVYNSAGLPLISLDGEGWSEQVQTVGKNLLSASDISSKSDYLRRNADGSITLIAVPSSNFSVAVGVVSLTSGQTYTLSGGTANTYLSVNNGGTYVTAQGSAAVFTAATSGNMTVALVVRTSATQGTLIAPQIEAGSTATSYEPYTGGAPAPSPSYPQAIQVAKGRNLAFKAISNAIISESGTIESSNTGWSVAVANVEQGATYTFNDGKADGYPVYAFYSSEPSMGSVSYNNTRNVGSTVSDIETFVAPVSGYAAFRFPVAFGEYQLELGSTPSPYVPYGHVGVEVTAENLAYQGVKQGVYTFANGAYNSTNTNYVSTEILPCKAGETYHIDIGGYNSAGLYAIWFKSDGSYLSYSLIDYDFTPPANAAKMGLSIHRASSAASVVPSDITSIYVGLGNVATIPIPLPLKSDGTRWAGGLPDGTADRLTVDSAGKWEWVNACEEAVFDGSESWGYAQGTGVDFYRFGLSSGAPGVRGDIETNRSDKYKCSHFIADNIVNGDLRITPYASSYISVRYDAITSAANFKTWLSTHNVTLLYPLKDPTKESGYVTLPMLPNGCTVTCPELENISGKWWTVEGANLGGTFEASTNTVNSVRQTADSNQAHISNITARVGLNPDGTGTTTDIVSKYSQLDQDLDGLTSRVGKVESQTSLRGVLKRDNWAESAWANYPVGKSGSWNNANYSSTGAASSSGIDASTLRIGDLIQITGKSTDSQIPHNLICKVTSVSSSASAAIPLVVIAVDDMSNVASRLSSAETSISQNTSAIALRATQSDLTNAINGIEIGGRNLLRFTEDLPLTGNYLTGLCRWAAGTGGLTATENGIKATPTGASDCFRIKLGEDGNIEGSDEFTISFDYRGNLSHGGDFYFIQNTSPNVSLSMRDAIPSSTTEWSHYSKTFTKDTANVRVCNSILLFYNCQDYSDGHWVEIRKKSLKLEKGSKKTGWTPAPEDMASEAELKVQADRIGMVVSNADASSSLELTSDAMTYIGGHVEITDPNGTTTLIEGGKLKTNLLSVSSMSDAGSTVKYTRTEYYLSTSQTSLSGGSWQSTKPTLTTGSYLWQRTAIWYATFSGTNYTTSNAQAYQPNSTGVCITVTPDIQVGGRNLAVGTNETTELAKTYTAGQSDYTEGVRGSITRQLGAKEYVLSFDAKATVEGTQVTCYFYSPNTTTKAISSTGQTSTSGDGNCKVTLTTEWKRYWVKYTQSDDVDTSKSWIVGRLLNLTDTVTCTYRAIKMEVGNTPTPWTRALEDQGNEVGGFDILWNRAYFDSDSDSGGEAYICSYDPVTATRSDNDGWVMWNGKKRTVPKGMINPNSVLPYNIPIYIVCRLNSASATTVARYLVWYNSGWKYSTITPSAVSGTWTWSETTDMVLGKFVEPGSEAAFAECEIYRQPLKWGAITTDTVTARSAQATANAAAPKSNAITETQRIYYRSKVSGTVTSPGTTWITKSTDQYNDTVTVGVNGWTTKITPLANGVGGTKYIYLYTATQKKMADGTVTTGPILLDDTTTIIDGGSIVTGSVAANKISVTDLQAFGATIGGFAIDTTSIHTKDVAVTSNADNSIALSSADFTRTILSTSRSGLRFAIGDKLGVTGDGVLYANGANITNINASNISSGTISADRIAAGAITIGKLADDAKYGTVYTYFSEGNTSQYVKLCTIAPTASNVNRDVMFSLSSRGYAHNTRVKWCFTNTSAPSAAKVHHAIKTGSVQMWYVAEGSGVYGIYTKKAESWELIDVHDFYNPHPAGITVTWLGTNVESLPSGAVAFTDMAGDMTQSEVLEQGTTATNYISMDSTNGLKIAQSNPATATSNYLQLNSNGAYMYKDSTHFTHQASDGFHVYSGDASNDIAHLGTSLRIGKTNGPRTIIQNSGVDYYGASDGSVLLAHIGYATGNASSGTSTAPYYTFGTRTSGKSVGNYSVAEGSNNEASGWISHAEGGSCIASGSMSHAEGNGSQATNYASHAEGNTTANGTYAHAEGFNTTSRGSYAHAQNLGTLAYMNGQTVLGTYNVADSEKASGYHISPGYGNYAVIVGNGTSDNDRSNALTLKWDGTLNLATALPISSGGTGATTAADAWSALGGGSIGKKNSLALSDISNWSTYIYSAQASRTANTVLAAPDGANGTASFRKLKEADIPNLPASKINSGKLAIANGGTGSTAVTTATSGIFTAGENINIASQRISVWGKVAMVFINIKPTANITLTSPAPVILTAAEGYRPPLAMQVFLLCAQEGHDAYMDGTGNVYPRANLLQGGSYWYQATYLLA